LSHLVGDYRTLQASRFSYQDLRLVLTCRQARRKLPQLLEKAEGLWDKVLQN
jgi:hypothetical protein